MREEFVPAADNGFFGPDSVTWKVWSYPTSITVGFVRAVTIEQLDPNLNAAVEDTGDVRSRTRTRYERTVRYFALVAFGDTATTTKAADVLVKVHSKSIGTDPVTRGRYDANNPALQLWIHMTAWHSILYCYETYGPGRLSEDEELQYWAECARAAECQTIDPADVPRTRADVAAYFESWRPHLAASEHAQSMTEFILGTEFIFPETLPAWTEPVQKAIGKLVGKAVVATYPEYIRKLFDIRQPHLEDLLLRVVLRPVFAAMHHDPALYTTVAKFFIPTTVPIVGPVLVGLPAQSPRTMTPREAQRRYGFDTPAQAHPELRRRQAARVFGQGIAPSDEGLIESEQYIGGRALKVPGAPKAG
ncbi:DUF2236 domain-containing protein [Nocardia stercoris]|uniref:DUF2236 domain-containing protein n=1 Tax=Nocardia stercoris TaxID=2483361 RepID=A0A3M2KQN0_9NOCA|nr:DUF2236 domain-containing protein [Nocardia stercoris]